MNTISVGDWIRGYIKFKTSSGFIGRRYVSGVVIKIEWNVDVENEYIVIDDYNHNKYKLTDEGIEYYIEQFANEMISRLSVL